MKKKITLIAIYIVLLALPNTINAQNIDFKSLSNYIGYDISVENGFLSKFIKDNKTEADINLNNRFIANSVEYDYHGITGNSMNIPRAQCTDNQGNIYITGSSGNVENNCGDITTIKINNEGEIVWTLRIPSPEFTVNSGSKIAIGTDGSINLVGYIWNQTSTDIIAVKISESGELLWQTIIGNVESFDVPTAFSVDNSGNFYIGGITHHNSKVTYYISKISNSGQLMWENIDDDFPIETWNEPRIMQNDSNGDIIICGSGYDQDLKSKTITMKFNGSGSLIWRSSKTFQTTIDSEIVTNDGWPTDFAIDNNNNIYITNNFSLNFIRSSMTFKYSTDGVESWNQTHQIGEKNTLIKQIFFKQNLLLFGGYHYGDQQDGFISGALNLDGSLNWTQISTNQLSPSTFTMSMDDNIINLNSISFDQITFGQLLNFSSISIVSGNIIESTMLNTNNTELGFTYNDFFHVNHSSASKSIIASTYYSQQGNVYEVLKINNSDNSIIWNTKFALNNTTRTDILESISDTNSNVYTLLRNFYVDNQNPNTVSQKSYLVKYNALGNLLSTSLIDDSIGLVSLRLKIDNNGNLLVLIKNEQSENFELKKISNNLQEIWSTLIPLNSLQNELIGVDNQNSIYIVTRTAPIETPTISGILVTKISTNGNVLFSNTYPPENVELTNNYAGDVLFDDDNNIIIGGSSTLTSNPQYRPTLLSISSSGVINFYKEYEIQNNSSSLVEIKRINNEFYLAMSSQNDTSNGIHMIKTDAQGVLIWQEDHFVENQNIFLNKLLYSGNNKLFTVSFKGGFFGGNIDIVSWDFNGDIIGSVSLEDNNFYQDAFSDNEHLYVLSQNQGNVNFPYRLLNWIGPFISSKITKLSFDLTLADNIDFIGPNFSMFEPKQLIPLNNSNLLISGRLFHEESFFEGLKFFTIPYQPLLSTPIFPENNDLKVVIAPNPAQNILNIQSQETINDIAVYDMLGKKVTTNQVSTTSIDVSDLAKGMYIVKVTGENNKTFTSKFIKE